jgi:hypothetical protein
MHVHLILPELAPWLARPDTLAHAPRLARFVARADSVEHAEGWPAALAPLYGVARQQDWPIAPLRALRAGIDPAGAYWLRATPVSMIPGRDDVRIDGPARLDAHEANALAATLDAHFAADGVSFTVLAPDEWVVRTRTAPSLVTHALDVAIGEPLRSLLATGSDADEWRRWEQEMQMLLHGHAVNSARESAGVMPVNGIWIDEGGTLAPRAAVDIATFGGDARVAALAHFAGRDAQPLSASFDAMLAVPASQMVIAAAAADLADVDARFIVPLDTALANDRGMRATIMTAGRHGSVVAWSAGAPRWRDRWRARRGVDLRALVGARPGAPTA